MPINAKTQELKELLCDKLGERGLFGEAASVVRAEPGVLAVIPAHKVNVRNQDLEVEAMHLRLKAHEIEQGDASAVSPGTTQ